jgi:hypothetical protein
MAGRFTLPTRDDNVSAWLEVATVLFRATLLKCLPLAMAAVLLAQLPSLYWMQPDQLDGNCPGPVLLVLHASAAHLLFIATVCASSNCAPVRNRRLQDQLQAAAQRWPALALARWGRGDRGTGRTGAVDSRIYLAVYMLP